MQVTRSSARSRAFYGLLAGLLLVASLAAGLSPAQAQVPNVAADPNASVANDGFQVSPNLDGVQQDELGSYVASNPGSGETVKGGDTDNEKEVGPALIPGQAPGLNSVIGADGRYRITGTTTYPYRAIAHITSSIGGCTGWFINANTVVTAGHCVHNGSWATNVRVYPGRNGSSTPYGSCGYTRLFSVTGWTSNRDRNYDYGAIKLNCTIGTSTGWFGFRWTASSLNGQATSISGYPGDKTYGTQWRHNDSVRISQTYRLYYANDTAGGQSGAPVWNNAGSCSNCGIAVHAYGVDGTGYNGGTRITQSVFNNLTTWKNS